MQLHYVTTGDKDAPVFVWAHGWGTSHRAFLPLAQSFAGMGRHVIPDFPGFGRTPAPPSHWGTAEYADAAASWIRDNNWGPVVWIGHSFGCRVGLQLAARHPDLVQALCLIAAAGLKRQRPFWKQIALNARIAIFKTVRKYASATLANAKIARIFGSPDYLNAGPLRPVFVRVVNEDLSAVAGRVTCPTLLLYGDNDTETPSEMGQRYQKLIPGAQFQELEGLDHYSILESGRHRTALAIKKFLEKIAAPGATDPHQQSKGDFDE